MAEISFNRLYNTTIESRLIVELYWVYYLHWFVEFIFIIITKNFTIMQAVQSVFMQHIADHGLSYGTIEEYNFRL